jgi:hypothetical protein
LFKSWIVKDYNNSDGGLGRVKKWWWQICCVLCSRVWAFGFGAKGGVEVKLVCSNTHVNLCIYNNFYCSYAVGSLWVHQNESFIYNMYNW